MGHQGGRLVRNKTNLLLLLFSFVFLGCASTPGAVPPDIGERAREVGSDIGGAGAASSAAIGAGERAQGTAIEAGRTGEELAGAVEQAGETARDALGAATRIDEFAALDAELYREVAEILARVRRRGAVTNSGPPVEGGASSVP